MSVTYQNNILAKQHSNIAYKNNIITHSEKLIIQFIKRKYNNTVKHLGYKNKE